MAIKTENKNGLTVCYVEGEIDINTSPDIKKNFAVDILDLFNI